MKKTNLKIDNFQMRQDFPSLEEKVLDYWDEVGAFKKSVEERPEGKPYVFYDGPPFATGLPHYGHILASTIKDVVPRYFTMKGYRVERVWGWDCHGLPIENMIEQELELKGGKKGIEELGIDKFNAACRNAVLKLDKEWEKVIRRIGRWVDFANNYKTMDKTFMESVWWAFKQLYQKDLIYEGRRVILYCPRCATPLSNFEIAMDNSYQDTEDYSITVKFKLKPSSHQKLSNLLKFDNLPKTHKSAVEYNKKAPIYLLAWTTTPWTLVGNVGLAVKKDADYRVIYSEKNEGEFYVLSQEAWDQGLLTIPDGEKQVLDFSETFKGEKLLGLEYERLFPYLPTEKKKAFYVAGGDFVSLEEGTGIVHTAAIYGEDDYELALKEDLPRVPMLDDQGKFLPFVTPLSNQYYKKTEDWIVKDLTNRGLMQKQDKITHSVAYCYRCNTQLFYNAVPAWFINIQKIKPEMVKQNENINWYPDHLKHGRFGNGLETAPDWNISRSRYWGTPMPIWRSESGQVRVIGSVEELNKWAVDPKQVEGLEDIHREFIDDIELWVDDEKTVKGKRIPEVFDCWVESGSMPYASEHYPFENKQKFEARHPAQFIAEYIAQTRAWFYTLHVMSVALFGKNTFENAVTTGTILAEDGSKMSKSKKNYPDPTKLFETHGVDALRLYLMSSAVMKAENLNFSEEAVGDIRRRVLTIWWNVFSFYRLFAKKDLPKQYPNKVDHVMDKWLVSITERLTKEVTEAMDKYDVVTSSRKLMEFVGELSTWYLRRSRDRLRNGDKQASQVFGTVLYKLSLLFAPFAPFLSELIYQNLVTNPKDSVHLEAWPNFSAGLIHSELEENMRLARDVVEKAHSLRKEVGVRLRQPLAEVKVSGPEFGKENLHELILEEINVKKISFMKGTKDRRVELNTTLSPALREEGEAREIVRAIQQARKEAGTRLDEKVEVELPAWPEKHETEIMEKVLASKLTVGKELKIIRK